MENEATDIKLQPPVGKKMKPSEIVEYDRLIDRLASLLKIARHPDSSITIKVARLLIENMITPFEDCDITRQSGLPELTSKNEEGKEIRIQKAKFSLGDVTLPKFISKTGESESDTKDELSKTLERASRALKLLYLDDQKQLQLKVNEIISSVQSVTADPKTDSKLLATGYKA